MEYNIINLYTKFIKDKFQEFFKIILKSKYQKSTIEVFLNKYIEVRYYNETNYRKESDFINRLNKELIDIYNKLSNDDIKDTLKSIVALFGYVTYLDDIYDIKEDLEVIDILSKDNKLKLDLDDKLSESIRKWYASLKEGKEKFYKEISTKEFGIVENKVYRKTYEITLEHNVKISNLYSELAINRAYTTGTVNEDKSFISYILTSLNVLNNAINLDFSNKYIVDLPTTLFNKEKKIMRLFNVIDNPLAKKYISIKINYSDYIKNKNFINERIKEGYTFAVVLDKEDVDINELILFSYIYVFEDSEIFDIINNGNTKIGAKIINL